MQTQQGVWSDLIVGSYMKDKNGKTWKVIAERDFHLQIQDRDGRKVHLQPQQQNKPVTLVVPTEGEAIAALQDKLKAVAVARREAGETGWLVPTFPVSGQPGAIDMARSHLIMMHGVWAGDVKRMDGDMGMTNCHNDSHVLPDKGYQEHTHPGGNPS